MSHPAILLLVCAVVLSAEDEIPKQNPYTTSSDVARGKQLFGGQCAPCHGPEGEGGRGANLRRPVLPRASDDQSLFKVLHDGIAGTEMPGAWAMSDHEMWQVAAFVRSLGRMASENVPGDAGRGRSLVESKGGCKRCHSIGGEGGITGPALTEVGVRRSAAFLRKTLLDPNSTLSEGFAMVQGQTRDGRRFSGVRLNEDTFSIQFRDMAGATHSFWKDDLSELRKDMTRSPMPSYRAVFSDSELTDAVAYLASLRGAE